MGIVPCMWHCWAGRGRLLPFWPDPRTARTHSPGLPSGTPQAAVNMTPAEVEAWLGTEESRRAVEQGGEAADKDGRHAARRLVPAWRQSLVVRSVGDVSFASLACRHAGQVQQRHAHRCGVAGRGPS